MTTDLPSSLPILDWRPIGEAIEAETPHFLYRIEPSASGTVILSEYRKTTDEPVLYRISVEFPHQLADATERWEVSATEWSKDVAQARVAERWLLNDSFGVAEEMRDALRET